jgi:hypothetical protein
LRLFLVDFVGTIFLHCLFLLCCSYCTWNGLTSGRSRYHRCQQTLARVGVTSVAGRLVRDNPHPKMTTVIGVCWLDGVHGACSSSPVGVKKSSTLGRVSAR